MTKARPNWNTVKRYQTRWYFSFAILFFLAVAGVLYLLQDKIVSPCGSDGCSAIRTVYAKENLSVKEEVLVAGIRYFGADHVPALEKLVFKESGFNQFAINSSSGACGLFQFLPCKKMKCDLADTTCQIDRGMKYIKARYGTPTKAWAFHQQKGWY